MRSRRSVLPAERSTTAKPAPSEEEQIARQARGLAERLAVEQQGLNQLWEQARALATARAAKGELTEGLASTLPHMVQALLNANLSIEETWVALGEAFSTEGLGRAIRKARRGAPSMAGRRPARKRRAAPSTGAVDRAARPT